MGPRRRTASKAQLSCGFATRIGFCLGMLWELFSEAIPCTSSSSTGFRHIRLPVTWDGCRRLRGWFGELMPVDEKRAFTFPSAQSPFPKSLCPLSSFPEPLGSALRFRCQLPAHKASHGSCRLCLGLGPPCGLSSVLSVSHGLGIGVSSHLGAIHPRWLSTRTTSTG